MSLVLSMVSLNVYGNQDALIKEEFSTIKEEIREMKLGVKRVARRKRIRRNLFSPPSVEIKPMNYKEVQGCDETAWWKKALAGMVVIPGGIYLGYKLGRRKRKTVTRTETIFVDREVKVPVEVVRPPTMDEIAEWCENNPFECG